MLTPATTMCLPRVQVTVSARLTIAVDDVSVLAHGEPAPVVGSQQIDSGRSGWVVCDSDSEATVADRLAVLGAQARHAVGVRPIESANQVVDQGWMNGIEPIAAVVLKSRVPGTVG